MRKDKDGGCGPEGAAGRVVVVYRPIAELKLDPHNPRVHSPRQIRQIARSIEAFGFNVPVLVDSDLKLIAGHGRVLAAQQLGLAELPTISLDHLTNAQARAFLIADNKLTDNSIWDDQLLAQQLRDLSLLDLDFSLEATGFEVGEIDLRIEGLTSQSSADDDSADAIPVAQAGSPVTRVGDLWLLGEHRVCCGSALDQSAYTIVMNGEKAALVFSDPPYNVPIDGNVCGLGSIHHREFAMASGEMSPAEFIGFLTGALSRCASHSEDGSLHFLCMGSLYRSQHELIFVFKHGRESHRNNIQLGKYGRNRGNVWRYPGMNSAARAPDEGNLLASIRP